MVYSIDIVQRRTILHANIRYRQSDVQNCTSLDGAAQLFSVTRPPPPKAWAQAQQAIQGEETRSLLCTRMLDLAMAAVHIHGLLTNQLC